MSDVDDDLNIPDFRLFFVNKECDVCPMHLFDFKADEWEITKLQPRYGDRVVKDGTEMVCIGRGEYRELGQNEEPAWDYSEPELAKIEEIQYKHKPYADRYRESQYINPEGSIGTLNHF